MRQWINPQLVQIIASCLFGAEPISEPVLAYCKSNHWEQISVTFDWEIQQYSYTKIHLNLSSAEWREFCLGVKCVIILLSHYITILLAASSTSSLVMGRIHRGKPPMYSPHPKRASGGCTFNPCSTFVVLGVVNNVVLYWYQIVPRFTEIRLFNSNFLSIMIFVWGKGTPTGRICLGSFPWGRSENEHSCAGLRENKMTGWGDTTILDTHQRKRFLS